MIGFCIINLLVAMVLLFNMSYFFQQLGYENDRILKKYYLITPNMVICEIIAFAFITFIRAFDSFIALSVIWTINNAGVLTYSLWGILSKKKVDMNYTARLKRLLLTCGVILIGIALLFIFVFPEKYYLVPLIYIFLPLTIVVANTIMYPVENAIRNKYKRQALAKLHELNPVVVAVTGSYAKTTTKNIIKDIFGEARKVLTTPMSYNTPMGICKAINMLESDTDIFIVEMGARKKGDIEELCKMVNPSIGVLTGINEQHIESFGNISTTVKTKLELGDYLASNKGILIINADSKNLEEIISNTQCNYILTTSNEDIISNEKCVAIAYVKNIQTDEYGTLFDYELNSKDKSIIESNTINNIRTQLIGKHNAMNTALAIGIAKSFGIDNDEILKGAVNVRTTPHRLEIIQTSGITILDDTYNSNSDGMKIAIDTLCNYSGRKILVTPGIVELGSLAYKVNYDIGMYAATKVNLIYVIGDTNSKAIIDGLLDGGMDCHNIVPVQNLTIAQEMFTESLQVGDIVLLANDLPDVYK